MEMIQKLTERAKVLVRVYDIFDGVDALWVDGRLIERSSYESIGCYEFSTFTMQELSICVANSCDNPSVVAMMETTGIGQVGLRGNPWGQRTARVSFNLVEFMFRALDATCGDVELVVAVNEDMRKNN